ncbi:MAG TPA: hypothetical protein VMZ11_09950 [Mycobacteriales bacterium]|nr:hypothetical protein [Mycobacteriales bacterium]
MVPARRYAPFVAVVAAQLLLVVLAPSKGKVVTEPQFALQQPGGSGQQLVPTGVGPSGVAGGPVRGPATVGTGAGGAPAYPVAVPGQQVGGSAGGPPDTSRCHGAKQFLDFPQAPPCVAHTGNPGATYPGVTGTTIKLVYFREKDNPVVKGLLQSQGLYSDPNDQQAFLQAMETFINKRYELYGRKVRMSFWQSPCEAAPPVDSCFRDDARALVAKEHPFAVLYDNNTNTPAFFDELSKAHVINFGGWHFRDDFNTSHRPYHWDALMGGDTQAELTGEYWCKKLAGKKARFAGSVDLRAKVRKAAVFYPQTSVNTGPAHHLQSILKGCGTEVVDVPYSPDTATASSQATSQVASAKNAGATSVLYFSDPIGPAFGTKAMTSQAWFPEHVLVGSGLIDYDLLARLYDRQQWVHAFGPSDTVVYKPLGQQEASITWRAAGRSGNAYSSAELQWSYWAIISAGMQMAGPRLDPGTFEQALLSGRVDTLPWARTHNPNMSWAHFAPGDYTANSDAKEVYWDPSARSPIDGKAGAYVALNRGRRYALRQWVPGEPALPAGV